MANEVEDKKPNSKEKSEDDAEEEAFLGDGFAIVDDVNVKEEDSSQPESKSGTENEATKKKIPAKVDGGDKKQKEDSLNKTKEDASTKKKEDTSAKKKEDTSTKKKEDTSTKKKEDTSTKKKEDIKKTTAVKEELQEDPPMSEAKKTTKDTPSNEKTKTSTSEPKDEALIITAEEDIDVAESTENKKENIDKSDKSITEEKPKASDSEGKTKTPLTNGSTKSRLKAIPSMWVSNIARRIKATDLKRTFSKHGRVITAKIVTNGKSYFGYVSMDSKKSVERCIKQLNNTKLGDKVITISSERPDAPKKSKPPEKKLNDDKKEDTSKDESAKDSKDSKDKAKKEKEDPLTKKTGEPSPDRENREKAKKRQESVRRDETRRLELEIRRLKMDNSDLRTRATAEKNLYTNAMLRAKRFERHYRDVQETLRLERKKFDRERDHLVKKNRAEQIKLEADRVSLEKERVDLRRRRDDLERELRKLEEMQRSLAAEKSHRSSRRSRSASPRGTSSAKRFKASEPKQEVKKSSSARWSGDRARTPPPPPKLTASSEARSKREHDRYYEERNTRREAPVYVPPGEYHSERESRHPRVLPPEPKSTVVVPPRSTAWAPGMPPGAWRSGGPELPAQYNDRYRDDSYRSSSSSAYPRDGIAQPREEIRVYSRVSDPEYRRTAHYDAPPRKY